MPNEYSENKKTVAIVTGGSRGLGRSTAISLAEQGTDVIITYQSNRGEADAVVESIKSLGRQAVAVQLDTGAIGSFDKFAETIQELLQNVWSRNSFDYLINNAGGYGHGEIGQITESDFDTLVNVHFKGVLFLTQTLAPLIADGGRIVNISTGLTRVASPGAAAYASVKGAVEVLTRYLAKELATRGITANTVAPGAVATDFAGGMVRDNLEINKAVASGIALGRVGLPSDIGPMVASLVSDANGWVTGQRIEVSGGMSL